MSDLDKAMDLKDFGDVLADAGEFLRAWKTPEGLTVSFVDPRPVGADPALFGIAMLDVIEAAAKTYARAVQISEEEAAARIWEGIESQRGQPATATPAQPSYKAAGSGIITFTNTTER